MCVVWVVYFDFDLYVDVNGVYFDDVDFVVVFVWLDDEGFMMIE